MSRKVAQRTNENDSVDERETSLCYFFKPLLLIVKFNLNKRNFDLEFCRKKTCLTSQIQIKTQTRISYLPDSQPKNPTGVVPKQVAMKTLSSEIWWLPDLLQSLSSIIACHSIKCCLKETFPTFNNECWWSPTRVDWTFCVGSFVGKSYDDINDRASIKNDFQK